MDEVDRIEMLNGLKDIATFMRRYYESLIDEGFSSHEALALTIAYQTSMLPNNKAGES